MEEIYFRKIAEKLNLSLKQVNNISQLNSEGSTIPFISRYRKEATGNMDEVAVARVIEEIKYFDELVKRKETVVKTIDGLGKLTPELMMRIVNCYDTNQLEDIYLPYKPKRKTRAAAAIEKGLEPLATLILAQGPEVTEIEALKFLHEKVQTVAEAIAGARDIIAEWIAEHEEARNKVRMLFSKSAILESKIIASKAKEEQAQKYRDYFEYREPLAGCPSHRLLAIRRGEKEEFLTMDISVDEIAATELLEKLFLKAQNTHAAEVKKAIHDSYTRLLKPSIENEFRLQSKNKADEEAIRVFAENLRQLLLASPLGAKRILAIDPGFRTGCKVVCLDEQGNFLHYTTIFPHPPQQDLDAAKKTIESLVEKYTIGAIGIGNGTAGRETEKFIREIRFPDAPGIFMVNESGASIYSASEIAREEFPSEDVTVRGAISIGRRLLDPLSELVKIDAKSIGVGQYQHDVNQPKLKESLDRVVESCVNFVGVDLNTASRHLLVYVSGLSNTLAKNIVEYRSEHGSFKSRDELRKVALMGPKAFEQCAGFLRIREAKNPLDNSSVHPERYALVQSMADDLHCSVVDLVRDQALRKQINRKKYLSETTGEFTVNDILKELEKPGRDPRGTAEEFHFDEKIKTIEDVKPGMTVPGIITNITNFGAFVDIGVKQDGLVHVSQLCNRYVTDPNEVVKLQQKVQVTVTEVDVARKRIALTMKTADTEKKNAPLLSQRPAPQKTKPATVKTGNEAEDFQAKLSQLKNKFR